MKLKTTMRLLFAGALISCAVLTPTASAASLLITDITQWIGPAAGTGVSQAVMAIQWPGQSQAFAWGYRWQTTETKTGGDMLAAFVAASQGAFTVTWLAGGFVTDMQWMGHSFPAYNGSEYLQYFVNNAQGSPFDGAGPGEWDASNTGVNGRLLVDGSWDGWSYSAFLDAGPAEGLNAPAPIPEPGSLVLVAAASLTLLRRRRSA
jgi:hypothetical protein